MSGSHHETPSSWSKELSALAAEGRKNIDKAAHVQAKIAALTADANMRTAARGLSDREGEVATPALRSPTAPSYLVGPAWVGVLTQSCMNRGKEQAGCVRLAA